MSEWFLRANSEQREATHIADGEVLSTLAPNDIVGWTSSAPLAWAWASRLLDTDQEARNNFLIAIQVHRDKISLWDDKSIRGWINDNAP